MPVVLFDDDADFREQLAHDLRAVAGHVQTLSDIRQLWEPRRGDNPCLVLMTLSDRGEPGIEAVSRVVDTFGWRCMVFTSHGAASPGGEQRALSLELGAEDVVERNAGRREIIARVKAVLRRIELPQTSQAWRVVSEQRQLLRPDGQPVRLTTAEFDLFCRLASQPGVAIPREVLFSTVFGRGFDPSDRAIDTLVSKLRIKLDDTSPPTIIRTVRPIGYVFTASSNGAG